MIENLETLVTLSKTGTMMEASTAMRISQSAVSKRIAALERALAMAKSEAHRAFDSSAFTQLKAERDALRRAIKSGSLWEDAAGA